MTVDELKKLLRQLIEEQDQVSHCNEAASRERRTDPLRAEEYSYAMRQAQERRDDICLQIVNAWVELTE